MSNDTATTTVPARPRVPRGVAMAGLATSTFLVVLSTAMVNLAGPAIREGLGLSAAELTVVASSYLVSLAGLLLLGGRLADLLGPRRTFLAAMSVYLVASVGSALAATGPALIIGRIGQGIGAAVLMPSALALLLALYPSPTERTRVMGVWGVVTGIGSLLGVFFGGTLTELLGWQSVFWTPVPFGVISAILVACAVPAFPGRPGRFDVLGAITITVGVSALALSMILAAEVGWAAPGTLIGLGIGIASLATFVITENRCSHPLVPLGVFRTRPVVMASSVMMMLGATMTSLLFFLPLYQQEVLGMTALATGLAQVPFAAMIIAGSAASPLLAKRIGPDRSLRTALALLLTGLLWLALNPTTSGLSVSLIGAFLLLGSGFGLGTINATTMAVRDSKEGESGLVSGLISTAQQLGGAIGLAALAGIAIGSAGADGDISFTTAFLALTVLILVAFAISLVPPARTRPTQATTGMH
ncbi:MULTISPECIES: MFS transporter [Actinoalloteichus]|uniref:Sugar phosphate permease n=1 Tax=Actinoalloteichus fjordicus TaxID=1612552 RepID=A0AAC9LAZ4_9PSEU|nr:MULTISPECIES: MFS transporter [Actinoalloteichus]APU14251.1 sugar phosphate permease [Actinoalloteichus fjordicus]APU20220.1 sugar phosphate permease [Actinoalloteichus sp. GBA129-24]